MTELRHGLEYALVRVAFGLVARLPAAAGDQLGTGLGRLAHRLGWRREVVEEQLALAFPDRDAAWVSRTARASFEHLGREGVAYASLVSDGTGAVRAAIETFEGLEDLRAAVAEGRGVVVVSGHFGNWEVAGAALAAYGFEMEAVMQGLRNRYLDRHLRRVRGRLGIGLIDRESAGERVQEVLRRGRIVAFAADQDARGQGVFVPFFGRAASTHRAPALMALRGGAPLFVGGAERTGRRRYRIWVVRVPPPAHGSPRERVLELTQRWSERLERRIRLSPEQYFWHHRRWKTRPTGTVPVGAGTM